MKTPSFSGAPKARPPVSTPVVSPQDAPPKITKYIVTKAFTLSVRGSTMNFSVGQVIDRPYLIDVMVSGKYPVKPVDTAGRYVCCPHCEKSFLVD